MSTSASTQTVLTIIKDKFAEVLTKAQTTKLTDWNVIITEEMLLEGTRTPSFSPEKIWHGLAALYHNIFPTHEEYRKFTANRLTKWGSTLDYKLFDTQYLTHWYHVYTIKNLWEQAKLLLEEADKINEQDKMVWHEIESHVQTITWSDLQQKIKKPQQVWVVVPPTPLPGLSRRPDYSHLATYGQNYACWQYQCFECGNPTHFKQNCPFYTCQTCKQPASGHAPWACHGCIHDDGIHGYYDIEGEYKGNLTREC
jgi:hypothetical protein